MRNKVVLIVLVTGVLLVGAMLWHARRQPDGDLNGSNSATATEAAAAPARTVVPASVPGTPSDPMVIATRLNQNPVKPAEVESLQSALDAGRELNPSQVGTVSKLLREIHPLDGEQKGHVRKNELMNTLNRQGTLPPETLDVYTGIYRDLAQDDVIRDYAIQHVYEAYDKLSDDKRKGDAVNLLQEAAAQSDSSLAGTAILALARLSSTDSNLSRPDIAATAMDLARNPSANTSARISALQVIGRFDPQAAVPVLLDVVQQGGSILEQISAIGALGLVGGPDQVPLLQTIAAGDNARLKPAALGALKRIQERTGEL